MIPDGLPFLHRNLVHSERTLPGRAEPEKPMAIADYSGPFDPHFDYSRLPKEALVELLRFYAEYMRRIDGLWYVTVKDRWGNAQAIKADLAAWEKIKRYELKTFSEIMNLHGSDVATVMKYLQVCPWVWAYDHRIEMRDENFGVFTKYDCPTLYAMEKEGSGREQHQCQEVCPKGLEFMTEYFNPRIKVVPLKVPPRTDYRDMCCQWGFRLE